MNPALDTIYREKELRRHELSDLSPGEKVKIMDKLRLLAVTMRRARARRYVTPAPARIAKDRWWDTVVLMKKSSLPMRRGSSPAGPATDGQDKLAA